MDDELKRILGEEPEPQPEEAKKVEEPQAKQDEVKDEAYAKSEQLANLNKAIVEAQAKLRDLRKAKKQAPEEEELPKIDMDDPSAKAWDRHIRENVQPLQSELDKQREEIRGYALRQFLKEKPALAKNSEKVKELMDTYERLHTASERTVEGVLMDLDRSYAAVFHEELINSAKQQRIDNAKNDILFSDIAVSRGATAYQSPKDDNPKLTDEEKKILEGWGMSVSEWMEYKKKYK
jgi:hypothetical protein